MENWMKKVISLIGSLLLVLFQPACQRDSEIRDFILEPGIIELSNHRTLTNNISLNLEKREELAEDLKDYSTNHPIKTIEDAIGYSLEFTSKSLEFRMDYFSGKKGGGYYRFPAQEVKRTDCIDYSFLFGRTLEYVCKTEGIENIQIEIKRSDNAELFGKRIDSHDWVKVTDTKNNLVWEIDPTFADYGLGSNIEKIVK